MAASWLLSPITLAILLISLAPSSSSRPSPPPSNTITSSSSSSSTANNVSFVARLIHISSRESPFYNQSVTREQLLIDGVRTSLDRHRYFSQRYLNKGEQVYSKAQLNSQFLMNYSVGTPPFQTFGLLDTGSSTIWLQCFPCVRCDQSIPIFFPPESSTYKEVECGSVECSSFGEGTLTGCSGGSCNYSTFYMDGSYSHGVVFSDTLTLEGDVTGETSASGILFGGGNYNDAKHGDDNLPGVIGLGNYSSSLLGQLLATQFSYLLSTNRDDDSLEGWVYFGQAASLSGFSTPLVPNDMGHYHLLLEAIYVGGTNLEIPDKYLQMGSDQSGGIIIDSGATYTILNGVAYEEVSYGFEAYYQHLVQHLVRKTFQGFELCYDDIGQPPELMFSFRDFNFTISQKNTWVRFGLLFCLAIIRDRDEHSYRSTLGYYQQRDVNIGYDLANYALTFFSPDF